MDKPDSPNSNPENPSPTDILQDQTEEIANQARQKINAIDDQFDQKADALEERLKTAKARADKQKPENNNVSGMTPSDARSLGSGLTIAYGLMGSVIGLWGVGKIIDNIQGNTGPTDFQLAPIFAMAGMVIGIVFAIYVTQRTN